MKSCLKIMLVLSVFLPLGCGKQKDISFDGKTLIGYELMKGYVDDTKPLYKWYHETTLIFKKDSVYIKQRPMSTDGLDTLYSETDGGFYFYKGTWKGKDNIEISTIQTHCDYCPVEVDEKGNEKKVEIRKNYRGYKTDSGLRLNGIEFKISNAVVSMR